MQPITFIAVWSIYKTSMLMVWTNYFVTLQVDYKMFDLCHYNQSLLYIAGQIFPKN